jgi:hypothetical protein
MLKYKKNKSRTSRNNAEKRSDKYDTYFWNILAKGKHESFQYEIEILRLRWEFVEQLSLAQKHKPLQEEEKKIRFLGGAHI